jgi:hypothetical protein
MSQGIRIENKFSQNVANNYLGFVSKPDYIIVSGTGSLNVREAQTGGNTDNPFIFKGHYSLQILDLDYKNTDFVFNGVGNNYKFRTDSPDFYFTSFYLNRELVQTDIDTNLKLEIFQDGSLLGSIDFPINMTTMPNEGDWYRFGQYTYFDSSRDYTFKWTLEKQSSAASNSFYLNLDGFCIQKLNTSESILHDYTLPRDIILQTTETIDVPSISSNSNHVLTVTLEGAEIGDFVTMTYPAELITLGLIVSYPVVTDTDEVSVILHNHSGSSVNPVSGDFKFKIVK